MTTGIRKDARRVKTDEVERHVHELKLAAARLEERAELAASELILERSLIKSVNLSYGGAAARSEDVHAVNELDFAKVGGCARVRVVPRVADIDDVGM